MNKLEKETQIYYEYQSGHAFKQSLGIINEIERAILFYEGKQWKMSTDLEGFPKIVLNVIKQIGQVKLSGILQNEYSFLVNDDNFSNVRKIQDFLGYLYRDLRMKKKNTRILKDSFKKGNGLMYFYWDSDDMEMLSNNRGRINCDVIDIRHVIVSNPKVSNIQEQDYVILVSSEQIRSLKSKYPNKEADICAESDYYIRGIEQIGFDADSQYVNVYTKYSRNKDGEVMVSISTQFTVLVDNLFLNPRYNGSKESVYNNTSLVEGKQKSKKSISFSLYPIANFVLDERDNCFYGLCGVTEYIEAQKAINKNVSSYAKSLDDMVLGGFITKKGTLGDNDLTNENGLVLELDLVPGESIHDVFDRIPVNQPPTDTLNFSGVIMQQLRDVGGATNIQMGQADYSGQTAKATQMLLSRAKENSSEYNALFEDYLIDCANIMFMFAKFYYTGEDVLEFNIIEHGHEVDTDTKYIGADAFDGNKLIEDTVMFDIQVSPTQSLSEAQLIEMVFMCVQTGSIDIGTAMKLLPSNYIPMRKEVIKSIDNNYLKVIEGLKAQMAQAKQVIEQMAQGYQKAEEQIRNTDTIITENKRLKTMLAEVSARGLETMQGVNKKNMEAENDIKSLLEIMQRNGSKE